MGSELDEIHTESSHWPVDSESLMPQHRRQACLILNRLSIIIKTRNQNRVCTQKKINSVPTPGLLVDIHASLVENDVPNIEFDVSMHCALSCNRILARACFRLTVGNTRAKIERILLTPV